MTNTLGDYDLLYKSEIRMSVLDLVELSARLGGVNSWDRRGNVVWYDDFAAAVSRWTTIAVDGTMDLSTAEAFMGTQSMKFTLTQSEGHSGTISRSFPLPNSDRLGLEVAYHPGVYDHLFEIYWYVYDGTTVYAAIILYTSSTGVWSIMAGPEAPVTLTPTKKLQVDYHCFHHIKLVVNKATGKYERLIVNGTEYDLSAYDMDPGASATNQRVIAGFVFQLSQADHADDAYIDNVVYTINEPAND